jgi:putative ATP-dependent endonuclease of the OLD family
MDVENIAIRALDYKCFGTTPFGFDHILPINLIIGKNNSGKSTLIDLIQYLTSPADISTLGHKRRAPRIVLSGFLTETELKRVFPPTSSGGPVNGNHWNFGKQWIGKPFQWEVTANGSFRFVSVDPPFGLSIGDQHFGDQLAALKTNPLRGKVFRRLSAERDIRPEADNAGTNVEPNGSGATRTIHHFINKASLPRELVEDTLLSELNTIFQPDGHFTDIIVQQHGDGEWEIYLEETEKGTVSITNSGSGLKTVLLVLMYLHLLPHIAQQPLSQFLFGMEELENNLHPALQRRLLLYLRRAAVEKDCKLFLTTHSNIAIDLFANDDQAQILHVTHDGSCASLKRVTTYVDNKGILDDLDVRASDLLQSNGIVWVEGPSDELYFNRWIHLLSDGALKEGAHYQCVFYGGRLLAHLSADDPDIDPNQAVKILRVNRHAVLLMDSDCRTPRDALNQTKLRIISEIESFGGMVWVTSGKEVENYLPVSAIRSYYNDPEIRSIEPFQDPAEYLDKIRKGDGSRFRRSKVLFAEQIIPHIAAEHLNEPPNLITKLLDAVRTIRSWNGLSV